MASPDATHLVDAVVIQRTVAALRVRNIETVVVADGVTAYTHLLRMVPEGADIFPNTSETLDRIGYPAYIHQNPRYNNLHDAMEAAPDPARQRELRCLSTVAEYCICPNLDAAIARVRGHTLQRHDQWLEAQGRAPSPMGKLATIEKESYRVGDA